MSVHTRAALLVGAFVGVLALLSLAFFVRTGDAMILVVLLVVANVGLVIAAVVHVLTRPDVTGVQRLIWLVIVVFVVPVVAVGALTYFILGEARTRHLFHDVQLTKAPPSPPPPSPPEPPRE